MEKKLTKGKKLRRKYAAALAGAAIMAGSALHGIPIASAAATKQPSISPPVTTGQTMQIDKDAKKPILDKDTNVTDPVAKPDQRDKNKDDKHVDRDRGDKRDQRDGRYHHERYKNERWADRRQAFDQRIAWYNEDHNKIQIYYDHANPVGIVMAVADNLGFDVKNDTFSLISQSGSQSIVRVVHNGANYNITVDHLSNGNWRVAFVNQIQ